MDTLEIEDYCLLCGGKMEETCETCDEAAKREILKQQEEIWESER